MSNEEATACSSCWPLRNEPAVEVVYWVRGALGGLRGRSGPEHWRKYQDPEEVDSKRFPKDVSLGEKSKLPEMWTLFSEVEMALACGDGDDCVCLRLDCNQLESFEWIADEITDVLRTSLRWGSALRRPGSGSGMGADLFLVKGFSPNADFVRSLNLSASARKTSFSSSSAEKTSLEKKSASEVTVSPSKYNLPWRTETSTGAGR